MSSGRRVSYIPPGERKSGIPDETEMPAPERMMMELHCGEVINRAMPARSLGAVVVIMVQ